MLIRVLFITFFLALPLQASKFLSDIVIFSYDRPLQLYSCLESIKHYVSGIHQISVIYKTSSPLFEEGYAIVKKDFPSTKFLHEGDFKKLAIQASFDPQCEYITFAVDDIILKDFVDLSECTKLLDQTKAYGFYP